MKAWQVLRSVSIELAVSNITVILEICASVWNIFRHLYSLIMCQSLFLLGEYPPITYVLDSLWKCLYNMANVNSDDLDKEKHVVYFLSALFCQSWGKDLIQHKLSPANKNKAAATTIRQFHKNVSHEWGPSSYRENIALLGAMVETSQNKCGKLRKNATMIYLIQWFIEPRYIRSILIRTIYIWRNCKFCLAAVN